MRYLDEKLTFGIYEGNTTAEIFCGTQFPEQAFLDFFLKIQLQNVEFSFDVDDHKILVTLLDFKETKKSYIWLINNFIRINVIIDRFTQEKILRGILTKQIVYQEIAVNLNYYLWVDDTYIGKQTLGSANEVIKKIKKNYGRDFKIFSDSAYIEWCLINLENYYFDPIDLERLQAETCHHFYGTALTWENDDVFQIEFHNGKKKFNLNAKAVSENQRKWEANYSSDYHENTLDSYDNGGSGVADHFDDMHYDGSGGHLDDDFIRDALDGDPDAYWNIE